jgi:hypothetical protein
MKRFSIGLCLVVLAGLILSAMAQKSPITLARSLSEKNIPVLSRLARMGPLAQSLTAHNSTLQRARFDDLGGGRIRVSMEATGDTRGDMTLILDYAADGTVTGGTWSQVCSYAEDAGGIDEDGDSRGVNFVDKGTLSGTIVAGSLNLNSDGSPSAITAIQLTIESGSLTYSAVTGGNGLVNGWNLSDQHASAGSSMLNF